MQDGDRGQQHMEQYPHSHGGTSHGLPRKEGMGGVQASGRGLRSGSVRRLHRVSLPLYPKETILSIFSRHS